MPAQARLGDYVNMNCPHGGIGMIVTGSGPKSDDGHRTARIGDTVICLSCGLSGTIVNGSPNVFTDPPNTARIGDNEVGTCDVGAPCCPHGRCGTIITGSPTVFVND
jgi:uncharacterized Zn-binding protein involved in type VI secretion